MRTNKELSNEEFLASQKIKRAMIKLYDGDLNGVEMEIGEALEYIYKVNK